MGVQICIHTTCGSWRTLIINSILIFIVYTTDRCTIRSAKIMRNLEINLSENYDALIIRWRAKLVMCCEHKQSRVVRTCGVPRGSNLLACFPTRSIRNRYRLSSIIANCRWDCEKRARQRWRWFLSKLPVALYCEDGVRMDWWSRSFLAAIMTWFSGPFINLKGCCILFYPKILWKELNLKFPLFLKKSSENLPLHGIIFTSIWFYFKILITNLNNYKIYWNNQIRHLNIKVCHLSTEKLKSININQSPTTPFYPYLLKVLWIATSLHLLVKLLGRRAT